MLKNGELVETGSFDELMAKKGAYYELYTAQARDQGATLEEVLAG